MKPLDEPTLTWLRLPARPESLAPLRAFALDRARAAGLPAAVLSSIALVLEEVLINVFHYAFDDQDAGMVAVGCGPVPEEGLFLVRVTDPGRPFDPLAQDPPDLGRDIADRAIGGLGILLARRMSRHIRYRRQDDLNVLDIYFEAS